MSGGPLRACPRRRASRMRQATCARTTSSRPCRPTRGKHVLYKERAPSQAEASRLYHCGMGGRRAIDRAESASGPRWPSTNESIACSAVQFPLHRHN
eukprot:scaffold25384_cov129-Isochrysis_galbana.AAC.9